MSAVADHPFLAGLPSGQGERLAGCATPATCPDGALLFRAGQPADGFFLLAAGRVALELAPPNGPPLTVETMEAGAVLGWSWLVPPHRWQFDGRARGEVVAFDVDAGCARAAMAADAETAAAVLEAFLGVVADRLRHTRVRLLDLYGKADHVDVG